MSKFTKGSKNDSKSSSPKKSQSPESSRSSKSSESSNSSSSKERKSKMSDKSHKRSRSNSNTSSPNNRVELEQPSMQEDDEDQLVKFNMNFTQLNDYLNNIIKVINQHAKILHNLNKEVQIRTTEKQIGEIFSVISAGLPYDTLIKKLGGMVPTRRGSVMKLLGDASLVQHA